MIIYSKYFFILDVKIYSFSIPLLLIPYTILSALLIISNYGYYYLLTTEEDKESPRTYHVTEIEDLSATYANIIMTYVLALLSIFPATLISLIVFIIVLFFIFELFKESEILFFNPILFLMGYWVYRVRVEEHNKTIYVVYREKIQEGDYIRVYNLYENVYLDERINKKKMMGSQLQSWGLRGRKASLAGMDSPLIESLNTSLPEFLLVTLMMLLPSSIEGLMGLWEEQPLSPPSFKGLDVMNESPPFQMGVVL